MENFELYIHGVPAGQDFICTDKIKNYLAKFYPRSTEDIAHLSLVIDYKNEHSYYTYYLKGNGEYSVTDFQHNRPGSYFAMTVAFEGKYCTKVKMLFDLLHALFEQRLCKSIFHVTNNNYRYKVASFSEANIYEDLCKLFENNIKYLSFESLNGFGNTSDEAVSMNLSEVDSPFFFNALRDRRVVVSSEYPTYSDRLELLKREVNPIRQENVNLQNESKQISEANKQLEERCASFKKEVESQKQKIAASDNDRKKALSILQKELDNVKAENERLKASMNNLRGCVSQVDLSTKELMRQLAGRFPEVSEEDDNKNSADIRPRRNKSTSILWLQIFNTLLLCAFIGGGIFAFHSISEHSLLDSKLDKLISELKDKQEPIQPKIQQEKQEIAGDIINYSEIAMIDIDGIENRKLVPGKTYTLSLRTKDGTHKISDECGKWVCDDDAVILSGNKLSIDSSKISTEGVVFLQFRIGQGIIKERSVNIAKK